MKRKSFIRYFIPAALIVMMATAGIYSPAAADNFPDREIEMVVCFSPGGSTDMMARIVSSKASELLKVPVVVVNKPGAGGSLAADYVAKSEDGYKLFTGGASNLGTLLATETKIPYQLKDFEGVARAARVPLIVVTKKGRYNTFEDLVKAAKAKPDTVTFGSWGTNSSSHLIGELIAQVVGAKMKHVPFQGGSKAMVATMGEHIDIAVSTISTSGANIKGGNLTALAITTDTRVPEFPDVPTLKELGYGDATFESYDGFATSAKVPQDRLQILRNAYEKAIQDPEVQKTLEKAGMTVGFMTGKEYQAYLAAQLSRLKKVAENAGVVNK